MNLPTSYSSPQGLTLHSLSTLRIRPYPSFRIPNFAFRLLFPPPIPHSAFRIPHSFQPCQFGFRFSKKAAKPKKVAPKRAPKTKKPVKKSAVTKKTLSKKSTAVQKEAPKATIKDGKEVIIKALETLVAKGKAQGFFTYKEINQILPE